MLRVIFKFFRDLFYAISIISIAVLAVLNDTIIYKYMIHKYELDTYTGLTTEVLMDNYKRIIYYLQNPYNNELIFNSVPMSNPGKIHFFEVKQIIIALYVISIIFILTIIFKIIFSKNKNLECKLIESFNNCVNIIGLIFITVSVMAVIDFTKTFYYFHKIFFKNDYWIFDAKTDPIINALPEEFFMIELISVVALLAVFILSIKVFYLRNKLTLRKG